jgi:hypothetical protein
MIRKKKNELSLQFKLYLVLFIGFVYLENTFVTFAVYFFTAGNAKIPAKRTKDYIMSYPGGIKQINQHYEKEKKGS